MPTFLELAGAVIMGRVPDAEVGPGTAITIPTGGLIPPGADAVVMVEHTTEPMPGHVELAARPRSR
jgi:molybdopterin molybdotransferase